MGVSNEEAESSFEPLLEVRAVRRAFGGVYAVDGASFGVGQGTITGLIGPNGAGKSTLINVISGFLKATDGSISFAGRDITSRPARVVAQQGIVRTFQLSSEFSRLTVLENLLVAAPNQNGESFWRALVGPRLWRDQERANIALAREILRAFNLSDKEDEYAGELSGGERRLVEIARAVMAKPKLLLLDEPTSGVQPVLVRRIERHLTELKDAGVTMLIVEHEFDVLERICDSVVVMARGKVLMRGSMTELRKRREVMDAYVSG